MAHYFASCAKISTTIPVLAPQEVLVVFISERFSRDFLYYSIQHIGLGQCYDGIRESNNASGEVQMDRSCHNEKIVVVLDEILDGEVSISFQGTDIFGYVPRSSIDSNPRHQNSNGVGRIFIETTEVRKSEKTCSIDTFPRICAWSLP